jgi:ligand-binding sensor domain-containing protein
MDKRHTKNNISWPGTLFTAIVIIVVIELISMPGNLLNGQDPVVDVKSDSCSNDKGISVKNVNAVIVDNDNVKWFSTEVGIVSFDGQNWKLYDGNNSLPNQDLKGVTYVVNPEGAELWIASPNGVTVARLPIDDQTDAITYDPENADILSKDVVSIAAGKDSIRWIGTEKGISALSGDKWLEPYYDLYYPERMFMIFPITSMATNLKGDSLYVGTAGAGVARVYRDDVDGISGASVYAQWGPIDLPSDNIQSIFIAPDGTKWFGTEEGIAKHTGKNTLDNWTVYTTDDGLVDNFVQAICGDTKGNIWFGTKAGISVFNGSSWISYTTDKGLASNNILSIATDQDGIVWIGTDAGITSYEDEKFINY